MGKTSENPVIGLDNVVIAELLSDDGVNAPTYGPVIPLRGAVQASVNPNSSVETDYADNGAFFVTGNRANIEMSLELTNVASATLAKMLGQKRVNGVTTETPMDQAPYFAMGFRVWIGGTKDGENIYQYFWYAKGQFSVPESGGTTKQEGVDFQHKSMTAQFVSTQYKDADKKVGVFCNHCRSDDDDAPASLIATWFDQPVVVSNADTSAFTVEAEQGSSRAKIVITGTKSSGGSAKFAPDSIDLGNTVIVSKDGVMIPGTFSVEDDEITFTADTAFSASDEVNVVITSGVKDVNGVSVTPYATSITIS